MKHLKKKGVLDNLGGLITSLGYIAVLAAIIFLIIGQTKSTVLTQNACEDSSYYYNSSSNQCHLTANSSIYGSGFSAAYNATVKLQSAASDIPSWLPVVIITMVGGILLTLVRFFRSN